MRTADGYHTRQRSLVEGALRECADRHITADELTELLERRGSAVGRTTVYRCLERLVREGCVRRYAAAPGESACYQYLSEHDGCVEHFHLKCEVCGRLIHMECAHMSGLAGHILKEHGFSVDPLKTVFYGVCGACAAAEQAEK